MPFNCNLDYVTALKDSVDIPLVCAGRMRPAGWGRGHCRRQAGRHGRRRQFLTDPQWVTKLMEDREEDIKPCICCHNACFTMAHYEGVANDQDLMDALHMARCALNPETMQSRKYKLEKASNPKKVAVIGGGIGGMESALVLAARGHQVTLYEKSGQLGGVFIQAAAPSYKEKDRELIQWYRRAVEKAGIDVSCIRR